MDLDAELAKNGWKGPADLGSVEVAALSPDGSARVFDPSRADEDRVVVPHRIEPNFGISRVTLSFVVPDEKCTRFAVYFDRAGTAKRRRPARPGLVGDGDRFREELGSREVNASHFDHFFDFDSDGDLDLFKGGVEPFVYCFENTGGGRMVERGPLTSGGAPFVLPKSAGANRSWVTVAFHDWDGDGDPDFLPSFQDGPARGQILLYRNTTSQRGGVLTFEPAGPLRTVSGNAVAGGAQAGGWFPCVAFARDWDDDGDGRTDLLVGSNNHCYLYRNLGSGPDGCPRLADAVTLQAGGEDIVLSTPRFDCADLDADGDLDLLAGTQPGPVTLFRNVGSRGRPVLAPGEVVAFGGRYLISDAHSGVKAADFDGDGRIDLAAGRFWERADLDRVDAPRDFGGVYRNTVPRSSTLRRPRTAQSASWFERSKAASPRLTGFPICDAIRQNCVRADDWDRDGLPDLLAGDTDGFVWLFRNRGTRRWPLFAPGRRMRAGGRALSVSTTGGHARLDVCDWNGDGLSDLLVADGSGGVTLFPGARGGLGPGEALDAAGAPVRVGTRASVTACDWDADGRLDLLAAGEDGYTIFRNVGAASRPTLAAGTRVVFAGRPVRYVRPNLGAFVDWDGDGTRDLIACSFENRILLYRNQAASGLAPPGPLPIFEGPEGSPLVEPWTVQMISGADAVDWNGDGDVDLLTGQGHGGSGLRFYERDFIEDTLRATRPIVSVLGLERRPP